jgi:DNA repair protein RadC
METEINLNKISEISISYNPKYKISQCPKITCSTTTYNTLINNWDSGRIQLLEEFKIILLNRSNRIIGISNISIGGISGTVVDPKIIFSTALKANASSIILAHNHPSGNLTPSTADLTITKKIVNAGEMLDIRVLDHLIITTEGYYSMTDKGDIHF